MMRLMIIGSVFAASLLGAIGCGSSLPPPPTAPIAPMTARPSAGGVAPGGAAAGGGGAAVPKGKPAAAD